MYGEVRGPNPGLGWMPEDHLHLFNGIDKRFHQRTSVSAPVLQSWLPLHRLKLGIWTSWKEGSFIVVEVSGGNDSYFIPFLFHSKCPTRLVFSSII